jgi:ACT domain-containing protein
MTNEQRSTKAIVTVVGQDKVGIVAGVTKILAESSVNILDLSQTIMQDYFTMIMLVDISKANVDFTTLKQNLSNFGEEIGLQVNLQHQDVFHFMHRI